MLQRTRTPTLLSDAAYLPLLPSRQVIIGVSVDEPSTAVSSHRKVPVVAGSLATVQSHGVPAHIEGLRAGMGWPASPC